MAVWALQDTVNELSGTWNKGIRLLPIWAMLYIIVESVTATVDTMLTEAGSCSPSARVRLRSQPDSATPEGNMIGVFQQG